MMGATYQNRWGGARRVGSRVDWTSTIATILIIASSGIVMAWILVVLASLF